MRINKIFVILIMLLALSTSASAYWAIVNVTFNTLESQAGEPVVLINPVLKVWEQSTDRCLNCNNLSEKGLGLRGANMPHAYQEGSAGTISSNLIDLTNNKEYYVTVEAPGVCRDLSYQKSGSGIIHKFNYCWGWCEPTDLANTKKSPQDRVRYVTEETMEQYFGGECNIQRGHPENPVLPTSEAPENSPRVILGEKKQLVFTAP